MSPWAPTGVGVGTGVRVFVTVGVIVEVASPTPAASVAVGPGVGVAKEQTGSSRGASSPVANHVNRTLARKPIDSRAAASGSFIRTRRKSLPPGGSTEAR